MKQSFRKLALLIGAIWMVGICPAALRAQSEQVADEPIQSVTPKQIRSAIDKARACLLSEQLHDGSWDDPGTRTDAMDHPTHTWGGYTSLATYALLMSGSKAQDPPIQKAEAFLEKADISGIYCLGLRLQVWQALYGQTGSAKFKTLAAKDTHTLLAGLNASGPFAGMWGYNGNANRIDHSVGQYGVLGLSAADQMNVEIPARAWTLIDRCWRSQQFNDGGWTYAGSPTIQWNRQGETLSMSAAGVATLLTTQDCMNRSKAGSCMGGAPDPNIASGLEYLARNFNKSNDLYTSYDIQRIGEITWEKYLGDSDWFATIASALMKTQGPDGNWPYSVGGANPSVGTSFGLLILSRGGAPVMMDKLEYTLDGPGKPKAHWDNRPSDLLHLTRWAAAQPGAGNFNWRAIKLSDRSEDLADAPILYISGDQLIDMKESDIGKLRTFVQHGGLIAGNADCDSALFTKSFESLGIKMFPHYEWRTLTNDHPLFSYSRFRSTPRVRALGDGKRELLVLFPADPGRAWAQEATAERLSDFELGLDLYRYAVEKTGWKKKR